MNYVNFSSSIKVLGTTTKIEDIFDAIKYGEYEELIQNYRDALSKGEP